MKKSKAKKACKRNKSRQRKRKVSSNGKKLNRRNNINKDTFIDANVEESPFKVFVAVYVMRNDEPLKLIQFETDRNSLNAIIDFVKGRMRRHGVRIVENTHKRLAEILTNPNELSNDLGTILENFLACFIDVSVVLEENPEQHVGFELLLDVDDFEKCAVKSGTKTIVEQMFNTVIGKPVNEELAQRLLRNNNGDE
jgi:hypothetical protein